MEIENRMLVARGGKGGNGVIYVREMNFHLQGNKF